MVSHTDLKNSHIIFFKSHCDVHQLYLLGRQLSVPNFLRSCYELATRDPFGHLLINFYHCSSYCLFKYYTAWANNFFSPLSKAEITPITIEKEKRIYSVTYGKTET